MIALCLLLAEAYCNGIKKINVFGDSLNTINYMKGLFKCNA